MLQQTWHNCGPLEAHFRNFLFSPPPLPSRFRQQFVPHGAVRRSAAACRRFTSLSLALALALEPSDRECQERCSQR